MFSGPLSICIDRSKLGDEKLLTRVKKMLEIRKPYTTIIQADGFPMSGGKDDFKTTLQAVAARRNFSKCKSTRILGNIRRYKRQINIACKAV